MTYTLICDICKTTFHHQHPDAKRCSEQCRKKFEYRKTYQKQLRRDRRRTVERNALPQICQHCKKEYIRNKQTKYCSNECMRKASSGYVPVPRNPCMTCGVNAILRDGLCNVCRRPRIIQPPRSCRNCGKQFAVNNLRRNHCSTECRKQFEARNEATGHRRRARKYGVPYDSSVTLATALERLGYVCGICKELLIGSRRSSDPEQSVLEHIIPMAAGGGHVWPNVQVAHRRCNDEKYRLVDVALIAAFRRIRTHTDERTSGFTPPTGSKL